MERLISRGAEADLYLSEWYGVRAVLKIRNPKPYRVPQLDEEIRRQRTVREATFLAEARRAGVTTPLVYLVDEKRAEIAMQFIQGERIRELLKGGNENPRIFHRLGESIANLHMSGIVHGDLTTSNFIVAPNHKLVFLDFGLAFFSNRLEDTAVDLHLMKQILISAHSTLSHQLFRRVLQGYQNVAGKTVTKEIQVKIREIERRARYARVD